MVTLQMVQNAAPLIAAIAVLLMNMFHVHNATKIMVATNKLATDAALAAHSNLIAALPGLIADGRALADAAGDKTDPPAASKGS